MNFDGINEDWFDLRTGSNLNLNTLSTFVSDDPLGRISSIIKLVYKWTLSTYVSTDYKGRNLEFVKAIYYVDNYRNFKNWNVANVLWYNTSLVFSVWLSSLKGLNHWDAIDDIVILGALPLKTFNHDKILKNEGVKHVITLLKEHELIKSWFYSPVIDWSSQNIKQIIISVADYETLENNQFEEGINYISECEKKNEKVLVHCRAGAGRSASLVTAWIALKNGIPAGDAGKLVKAKRPQVNLNDHQIKGTTVFLEYYLKKYSMK